MYRVGKYGVDVEAIDICVEESLSMDPETAIYLIDEIGKMECFSESFVQRVSALFDSGKTVVATIALNGKGFISEVKCRKGGLTWEITRQNREELPHKVVDWIRKRIRE